MPLEPNVAKGAWIFQKSSVFWVIFVTVVLALALKGLLDITWSELPMLIEQLWSKGE